MAGKTRFLDPIDRVSEVLFGLIMVLTSTGALSVMTAGRADIKAMIVGALGCNVAWGIIDAGMYLMGCLEDRGRTISALKALRSKGDHNSAHRAITGVLPDPIAAVIGKSELEPIRKKLRQTKAPAARPRLTADDWLGAGAVGGWVILSTFPVVLPFFFTSDAYFALRISNAIAVVLLFLCGYAFALCSGLRPWPTGLLMVAVGCVQVGIAIALGG